MRFHTSSLEQVPKLRVVTRINDVQHIWMKWCLVWFNWKTMLCKWPRAEKTILLQFFYKKKLRIETKIFSWKDCGAISVLRKYCLSCHNIIVQVCKRTIKDDISKWFIVPFPLFMEQWWPRRWCVSASCMHHARLCLQHLCVRLYARWNWFKFKIVHETRNIIENIFEAGKSIQQNFACEEVGS